MKLQKKTNLGILTARYKPDDYPGFWIDLRREDGELVPICNVEYEPSKNCIQIVVYKDSDTENQQMLSRLI